MIGESGTGRSVGRTAFGAPTWEAAVCPGCTCHAATDSYRQLQHKPLVPNAEDHPRLNFGKFHGLLAQNLSKLHMKSLK